MNILRPGEIRLRNASRRFRVVHDRSLTLKETLIRRERARYSELWALRDVSLDIEPGQAVAIVGRNGSGKSTLLKMLAGIIPPHSGTVQSAGSIASMLELGAGFHPDFTGRENVFMNGAIHGLSERQIRSRLDEIVEFSELPEFIDMPVRTYSSGMQMRLAFAVAAHVNPDILLLDEVLAVGDEAFQRKCLGRIFNFLDGGGTLVFVSHDPNAVEQVCSRAILIDNGRIDLDGTPVTVMERYHRLLAEKSEAIGASIQPATGGEDEPEIAISPLGGWGAGTVAITGVELLGERGPTNQFVSGDELRIAITVQATEQVDTPTIGFSIATGDGTLVYGTNTRLADFEIERLAGTATIGFRIPSLALHEGRFDLNLAVVSHDESLVYHWIDRALDFSVYSREPGVGIADLSGEWRIEPSSEA